MLTSAAAADLASLPRVLVVTSNNFNQQGGGGITLTNLFRGWPADRLANVHEDPMPPDLDVCSNVFRLTSREVRWIGPFRIAERWTGRARQAGETGALDPPAAGTSWKRRLVGDGVPRDVSLSAPLTAWIDRFHPEVVYGFLGSIAQMRLVRRIADRWQIPIVVHIMDDWPAVIYSDGLLGPVLRRMALDEFGAILNRAAVRMAISDAMAAEYARRYGHRFLAFQNALDTEAWASEARTTWTVHQPATIRYVGSILAEAQLNAIKDVCSAVAELRQESVDLTLAIHAPDRQAAALRDSGYPPEVLRIVSAPQPPEVPRLLSSADVLLLPFNFDAASVRYIRLSMPTKVPAYMISGTPVLAYGPTGVATVDYARRDGWAETVCERNSADLKRAIRTLLTDSARREALGRRAIELARERHDLVSLRAGFWRALIEAASPGSTPAAAQGR